MSAALVAAASEKIECKLFAAEVARVVPLKLGGEVGGGGEDGICRGKGGVSKVFMLKKYHV